MRAADWLLRWIAAVLQNRRTRPTPSTFPPHSILQSHSKKNQMSLNSTSNHAVRQHDPRHEAAMRTIVSFKFAIAAPSLHKHYVFQKKKIVVNARFFPRCVHGTTVILSSAPQRCSLKAPLATVKILRIFSGRRAAVSHSSPQPF